MLFFVRNAVVFQILFLAIAYGWIDGGTRPDLLLPVVPWLAALVVELALIFPQAKSTETLADARERVWHLFFHDPYFYLVLLFTVFLTIPLFNVAGVPHLDAATHHWVNPKPPIAFLPFCVDAGEHASLLLWFPPVLFSVLAAKHGLLKRGKRLLLEGLCWNGAALAMLGFLQILTHAKSVYWGKEEFSYFFSTFGYPNFAGAFFTLLFVLSLGLWFGKASAGLIGPQAGGERRSKDETSAWQQYGLLIPAALNLLGAITSLSRAAILLCVVCTVVYGIYMVYGMWQKSDSSGHIRLAGVLGVAVLFGTLGLTILAPDMLKHELQSITPTTVWGRVSGEGYHTRVAYAIFKDYPVCGVGGWGYPHYQAQYLTENDVKHFQDVGGANVHNDLLQFLAELGGVGTGLLLLCILGLVVPLLIKVVRFSTSLAKVPNVESNISHPKWLYRLPPEIVAVFVGCGATVLHSLGDLPFRNPAILIVWFCAFVCASGFIPKIHHSSTEWN